MSMIFINTTVTPESINIHFAIALKKPFGNVAIIVRHRPSSAKSLLNDVILKEAKGPFTSMVEDVQLRSGVPNEPNASRVWTITQDRLPVPMGWTHSYTSGHPENVSDEVCTSESVSSDDESDSGWASGEEQSGSGSESGESTECNESGDSYSENTSTGSQVHLKAASSLPCIADHDAEGLNLSTTEARQKTPDNDSLKRSSSTSAPSEEQPINVLDNDSCHKSSGESIEESSSKPAPSEEQPTNVPDNYTCNKTPTTLCHTTLRYRNPAKKSVQSHLSVRIVLSARRPQMLSIFAFAIHYGTKEFIN
jgi:hypothetical protein